MYHVCRILKKNSNKLSSLLQTCYLNVTFFHDIWLTCEKEIPSNSFGLLANGEGTILGFYYIRVKLQIFNFHLHLNM
jgi:hypothetical protein